MLSASVAPAGGTRLPPERAPAEGLRAGFLAIVLVLAPRFIPHFVRVLRAVRQ